MTNSSREIGNGPHVLEFIGPGYSPFSAAAAAARMTLASQRCIRNTASAYDS
jgi:hypothetical protein